MRRSHRRQGEHEQEEEESELDAHEEEPKSQIQAEHVAFSDYDGINKKTAVKTANGNSSDQSRQIGINISDALKSAYGKIAQHGPAALGVALTLILLEKRSGKQANRLNRISYNIMNFLSNLVPGAKQVSPNACHYQGLHVV